MFCFLYFLIIAPTFLFAFLKATEPSAHRVTRSDSKVSVLGGTELNYSLYSYMYS